MIRLQTNLVHDVKNKPCPDLWINANNSNHGRTSHNCDHISDCILKISMFFPKNIDIYSFDCLISYFAAKGLLFCQISSECDSISLFFTHQIKLNFKNEFYTSVFSSSSGAFRCKSIKIFAEYLSSFQSHTLIIQTLKVNKKVNHNINSKWFVLFGLNSKKLFLNEIVFVNL